jgi:hypothetical protein
MKTPSHAIINLATLSKTQHSEWNLIIVIGGILPDIPIFYIGDRGHGAVPFPYGDRSLDGCTSFSWNLLYQLRFLVDRSFMA